MKTATTLALITILGCKGDAKKAPPVAGSGSDLALPDAAPSVTPPDAAERTGAVQTLPLPVGKIEGAYYYSLQAQLDAPLPDDTEPWGDGNRGDKLVRPATHAPAVWTAVVGRELPAYTAAAAPCPVKVTGVFLFEKPSAEEALILGKVEPTGKCVPAVIGDATAPTVFTRSDATAADKAAVTKALAADSDHQRFLEDNAKPSKKSDHVYVLTSGTARFALATTTRITKQDCGTDQAEERALFALPAGAAPEKIAIAATQTDEPGAALDVDHDGTPEILYGEGNWDWGMGGATQFAAVWPVKGDADPDVALSYYIGCD